jgi:hypothetical protein
MTRKLSMLLVLISWYRMPVEAASLPLPCSLHANSVILTRAHFITIDCVLYLLLMSLSPNDQELPFVDGDPPPESIIRAWLNLVREHTSRRKEHVIAVHCIAYVFRFPLKPLLLHTRMQSIGRNISSCFSSLCDFVCHALSTAQRSRPCSSVGGTCID